MAKLTKAIAWDFSGTERIKAPLCRLFWYFVTFGKWGERYHYKHVDMRRYFTVNDSRIKINISANVTSFNDALKLANNRINHINCRSRIKVIK